MVLVLVLVMELSSLRRMIETSSDIESCPERRPACSQACLFLCYYSAFEMRFVAPRAPAPLAGSHAGKVHRRVANYNHDIAVLECYCSSGSLFVYWWEKMYHYFDRRESEFR